MLPGSGPLDGSRSLRTDGTLGDPNAVALRIFDSQRQLSADLAIPHLERVFYFTGQGTRIRQWRGVAYIEHKQHRPHRLQDYNRSGTDFDLSMVVLTPLAGSAREARTRHLRVDQHRVEGRIEPKPTDEPHQFEVGIARIKLAGEIKELVECYSC